MDQLIQNLRYSWKNTSDSTMEFANAIPSEQWHAKPFNKRFTNFSWEFACIARTRLCYLKGFKTQQLNFSAQPDIPDKSLMDKWAKDVVIQLLSDSSKSIMEEIKYMGDFKVTDMVTWLLQHERVHHGKLLLYLSISDYLLSSTFIKTWGESNFKLPTHSFTTLR